MTITLDNRCGHGLLKSEPCRFCAAQTSAAEARRAFAEYQQAVQLLASNFTTVDARREAILARDGFFRDAHKYFHALIAENEKLRQVRAMDLAMTDNLSFAPANIERCCQGALVRKVTETDHYVINHTPTAPVAVRVFYECAACARSLKEADA